MTKPLFKPGSQNGGARGSYRAFRLAWCAITVYCLLPGCSLFDDPPIAVIAVPQETVPLQLDKGEPAPVDGWLFSDGLLNELSPAIRDHYEGTTSCSAEGVGTGASTWEEPRESIYIDGGGDLAAPEPTSGHSIQPLPPTTRDFRAQGGE